MLSQKCQSKEKITLCKIDEALAEMTLNKGLTTTKKLEICLPNAGSNCSECCQTRKIVVKRNDIHVCFCCKITTKILNVSTQKDEQNYSVQTKE
jgi:hypothetical protein